MYQDAICEVPLTDKDLRCSICLCPKLWTVAEKCCTELLHRTVVLSLDSRDDALCILDLKMKSNLLLLKGLKCCTVTGQVLTSEV